jgi:hypothetical protein
MYPSGGAAVARPRGRPKRSERQDVSVKINQTIVGRAKLIAKYRGISVAELLSDLLEVPLDRAYLQMLRELEAKG